MLLVMAGSVFAVCTKPDVDIVDDDVIDVLDLVEVAHQWLEMDCCLSNLCEGTDLDASGTVDMGDFSILAENWQMDIPDVNSLILRYVMGQNGPQVQDPAKTAAGGDLQPGSGVNLFNVNFTVYPSWPALTVNFAASGADLSTAITNDRLFSFELTVGTDVTDLDLTSLSFNAGRGGASTPRGYGLLVTTPTTTDQMVQSATDVDTVRPEWDPQFIDLSNVDSLQNLSAGQVVRFTLPLYSPGLINSLEFDDITVRGIVKPRLDGGELLLVESKTRPDGAWNFYSTRTLQQLPSTILGSVDNISSPYGGWDTGQTCNATGFFYPLKIGDRWWLVDPDGHLFLHKGVAAINTINSPGAQAALASLFGTEANWAAQTTAMMRQHGFYGSGAWSNDTLLRQAPQPLVYTIKKSFMTTYSESGTDDYPQVFDPGFQTHCQTYAQSLRDNKNDPYLLGYFSDNELSVPSNILPLWLGLSPGNSSYEEAWRWLRERYGANVTAAQVTTQDEHDFLGHVWGQYYKVVNQAIKQYDPNHLYMGSRLFWFEKDRPEIFREIGPYVDVVSVNHYGQWTPDIDRIRMWESESGRPVIITEYYTKGEDSGMPNNTGAGWIVRTQEDRGRFYQNFTLALLESKVCVGWHWFRYADNDPDSNPDPSNVDSNKGIVSNRYVPWMPLLESMHKFNDRVYTLTEYFDGTVGVTTKP
jgi:hypothetical protein